MNKFFPPQKAIENAKLGLYLHKKYNRGGLSLSQAKEKGIDSGLTRAQQIISGNPLPIEIIKKTFNNEIRIEFKKYQIKI